MEPGDLIKNNKSGLNIFCHNAKTKRIIHFWKTIVVSNTILKEILEEFNIKIT
jgi:hypothetical protein